MHGTGFFQSMQTLDGDDAAWNDLWAGATVFQCARDALAARGPTLDAMAIAKRSINRTAAIGPNRQRLVEILALSMTAAHDEHGRAVLVFRLFSYGDELHAAGHLHAAAGVFGAVSTLPHDDADLRMRAMLKMAFAHRLLGDYENAALAYDALSALAVKEREREMELNAQLGHAKIALDRGELDLAGELIRAILIRARRAGLREIIGKALVDRSRIAGERHDPVNVLIDTQEALGYITAPDLLDRARLNMAEAFREVAHTTAARNLAVCVAEHGHDQDARTLAWTLRYHLAVDAEDDVETRRCRDALEALDLPPQRHAEYCEAVMRDHAAHRRWVSATWAARSMRDGAERINDATIVARAHRALVKLAVREVPVLHDYDPPKLSIAAKETLAAISDSVLQLCHS